MIIQVNLMKVKYNKQQLCYLPTNIDLHSPDEMDQPDWHLHY